MILNDIRYAARSLWLDKGFAAVGIVCLGLGIGVNTTIFSILDGVLLKPYPYEDPDRVVVLGTQRLKTGDEGGVSAPDMRDWRAGARSFSRIGAVSYQALTISDGAGEPDRYRGAAVSWDMFRLLGVHPALGRHFEESEDQPTAAGVVLLSHLMWSTRYGADPQILGRRILINGAAHTVVGVMPRNFLFPESQRLWIPLQPRVSKDPREWRYLFTFGRLAPGVTPDRALADLNGITERLAREYPATNGGWSARIQTLRESFLPDDVQLIIGLMMASVTIVLFIACSNIANLLLTRASARRRELAVRVALGAGRGRIVRQLLTEAVVLALASVPLGLLLAVAGTRLIAAQVPVDQIPYFIQWSVDSRSLAYTIAVAVSTALVFGLVPAIQTTSQALQENLKEGARGSTGSRALVRNALVVSQVSLSVVALVGAMLFVRSYRNLDSQQLGFDTRPLMTMRFFMGDEAYGSKDARLRRVEEVVRGIESLPGVQAAFASNLVPISGGGSGGEIEVDGRKSMGGGPNVSFLAVTPGFHRTLDVRIRRGRDLGETEVWSTSPVAVINESMARRVWPNEDPIGRRFRFRNEDDGAREWLTVVGVAPDLQLFGINPQSSETPPSAFAPYGYSQTVSTGVTIRVAGEPASITSLARAVIRTSDPGMPITAVSTMEDLRSLAYWEYLIYGWIFGVVGATGVLLASIGVYGVLAYSVSQRTQEIGVRVALGAGREHVLKLVVGQGLGLALVGVVVGLVLAALGTPLARSLLFNVSPFDPLSFVAGSVFLVAVALIASYVPARRATRVDPVVALRQE